MSDYNKKEKLKIEELKNLLALLDKAEKSFDYSIDKCHSIGIKEDYSFEELDAFEALTARFARISDILIQKILSLIFIILKETPLTTIDKINMAEKYGIIKSADGLLAARELRNEISHEYKSADILTLFHETLKMSNILSLEIANIKTLFSRPRLVKDLITTFVSGDITKNINFSTLKKLEKHFVSPEYIERESNIIYGVKFKTAMKNGTRRINYQS